jgi:Protein of unknown function (DUF3352)
VTDLQTQTVGAPPGKTPGLVGTDDGPPDRPRRRWIALLLVVLLVIGGAAYGAMRFFAPADDRALDHVPKESFAYVNVFLHPSTAQRRAIRDLLERFPVETPDRAEDLIGNLLDVPLSEIGLEFERDVKPWLGDQAAGFVLPPENLEDDFAGGFLLATEDESATEAALDKYRRKNDVSSETHMYEEREYERWSDGNVIAFTGSFLFVGTTAGFERMVDTESAAEGLGDTPRYRQAIEGLEQDRLAIAYLNTAGLFDAIEREAGPDALPLRGLGLTEGQTTAAVMYVTDDGVVVDQASEVPERGVLAELSRLYQDRGIIERLPRDSWFALNLPGFGDIAKRLFAQVTGFLPGGLGPAAANEQIKQETGLDLAQDVFSWMGDAALYVSGTNRVDIGGGVVVASTDPKASTKAVHKLAGLAIAEGAPVEPRTWTYQGNIDAGDPGEDRKGYALDIGAPEAINLVHGGEQVVLAYGDEATGQALDASSFLGDTLEWREAVQSLDNDYVPLLYVDLQAVRVVVEAFGADKDEVYLEDVQPWLKPLSHVISGARQEGDRSLIRTVIGVL